MINFLLCVVVWPLAALTLFAVFARILFRRDLAAFGRAKTRKPAVAAAAE
jgi:hypothetical protein